MPTLTGATFREHLRRFRREHDWTQADLAEQIGCHQTRIAQIESHTLPSYSIGYKLAEVCGLDSGEVLAWIAEEREGKPAYQELGSRYTPRVMNAIRGARSRLQLAGVTRIRTVRGAREDLIDLVEAGGVLQVAILNPTSDAFRERRRDESINHDEHLPPGRITRRMDHEAHVVAEMLKVLYHHAIAVDRDPKSVELRVFDEYPKASITVVDKTLAQYGPYHRAGNGQRRRVKVAWAPSHEVFRETESAFRSIWEDAHPIPLGVLSAEDEVLPFEGL